MEILDCLDESARPAAVAAALSAVLDEKLIVMPTDTAYALAGYAFAPSPPRQIRAAKGMDPGVPLQVLISGAQALHGVAWPVPEEVAKLVDAFWPGPLTLIVASSPSLQWQIGGRPGVVQVRAPRHPVATELLNATGPLVASAARGANAPIAESAAALGELGANVAVMLDCGPIPAGTLSTIVDCTGPEAAILRKGQITVGQLVDVLGYLPATAG